jgi:hypothetical protein
MVDPSRIVNAAVGVPRTSKLIIDATTHGVPFPAVALPSADALRSVRANWPAYGVSDGTARNGRA